MESTTIHKYKSHVGQSQSLGIRLFFNVKQNIDLMLTNTSSKGHARPTFWTNDNTACHIPQLSSLRRVYWLEKHSISSDLVVLEIPDTYLDVMLPWKLILVKVLPRAPTKLQQLAISKGAYIQHVLLKKKRFMHIKSPPTVLPNNLNLVAP